MLTVGAGGGGGDFVNQAMAYNSLTHALISNVASATVRIVGDPTFDCPDLIGKVFDDANANGVPDPGEKGIAGVAPGDGAGPVGHDGFPGTLSHRVSRDSERRHGIEFRGQGRRAHAAVGLPADHGQSGGRCV